jgi:hypothetical protein
LSEQLYNIIDNFLMTSELLADKRKFPLSQLGKIVVDTIVAFPWMHSVIEDSAARRQCANESNGANNDSNGDKASFASMLNEFMNEKHKRLGDRTKATILVDTMWDDHFLEGEAKVCMIEKVKRYVFLM